MTISYAPALISSVVGEPETSCWRGSRGLWVGAPHPPPPKPHTVTLRGRSVTMAAGHWPGGQPEGGDLPRGSCLSGSLAVLKDSAACQSRPLYPLKHRGLTVQLRH